MGPVWKESLVWTGVCCMASCCILSLFLGRSCSCRFLVSLSWCMLPVILCCNLKAPSLGELRWNSCFSYATIREKLLFGDIPFLIQGETFKIVWVTIPSSLLFSPLTNLAVRLWMVCSLFTSFLRWDPTQLVRILHLVLPGLYTPAPWSVVDILRGSFSGMPVSVLSCFFFYVAVPLQVWLRLDSKIGKVLY